MAIMAPQGHIMFLNSTLVTFDVSSLYTSAPQVPTIQRIETFSHYMPVILVKIMKKATRKNDSEKRHEKRKAQLCCSPLKACDHVGALHALLGTPVGLRLWTALRALAFFTPPAYQQPSYERDSGITYLWSGLYTKKRHQKTSWKNDAKG
jgi:hypothetical protein